MANFKFQAPDGQLIEIQAPEGASEKDAQLAAAMQWTPLQKQTGFTGARNASWEELKGNLELFKGRIGLEDPEVATANAERARMRAAAIHTPTTKTWGEAPLEKFKELAGSSSPYVEAAGLGALAAAAPEAIAARSIVPLFSSAAPMISRGLASSAVTLPIYAGSAMARDMEANGKKLQDTSLVGAVAIGGLESALDRVGFGMIPGVRKIFGQAGKELTKEGAEAIAKQSLRSTMLSYGKEMGKAATAEGLTEVAQEALERLYAGLDMTDEKARDDYWQNFLGGAVLGGALSLPGHMAERHGKIKEGQAELKEEAKVQGVQDDAKIAATLKDAIDGKLASEAPEQVAPTSTETPLLTANPDVGIGAIKAPAAPQAPEDQLALPAPEAAQAPVNPAVEATPTDDQHIAEIGREAVQLYEQEKQPKIGGEINPAHPMGNELLNTQRNLERLHQENMPLLANEVQPKTVEQAAAEQAATQQALNPEAPQFKQPQVNPEFVRRAGEVASTLIPQLRRFGLENVGLKLVDSLNNGTADGSYARKLITVALDTDNHLGTLRHETIHALKHLNAFSPQEWQVLNNKAKSEWIPQFIGPERFELYKQQYLQDNNGDINGFDEYINEEAIADAFKHYNGKMPAGIIGNIMYRLKQFFNSLGNAFRGHGFNTSDSIFSGIENTKYSPREAVEAGMERQSKREAASPAPEDVPQHIWDLHEKVRLADDEATGRVAPAGVGGRGKAPGALKRNQTMAFRRLNDAIEKHVGSKEWHHVEPLMRKMSEESNRREQARENGELEKAEAYAKENGIMPYTSEKVEVPIQKYSIKAPSKQAEGNDPSTGLPLNKNGSVTLYYPTTLDEARRIGREKSIYPSDNNQSRIYLTNESSGWKTIGEMGNMAQKTDGSVARVEIDPSLLQLDKEYPDGRKDFFVPIKEGAYFNKKMRLWAAYAERNKAIPLATKYKELGDNFTKGIEAYEKLNPFQKRERLKEIRKILKDEHNVGTLLTENGKLEKTKTGDYGLTYDDQSVASLGLGLASAQKLNDKASTCPVSAMCEGLCLGDTSGNNMMYGGMATGEIAEKLATGKTSFRAGARLSQYLKTEAMIVHPEEFITLLHHEITNFEKWARKNDYKPAIRLNVTSDIPPKYYKSLIEAHPDTMFYDYTKLDSNSVAPNHHLTYSSTGASQVVDGEEIESPL
jgi:hypothetical protein